METNKTRLIKEFIELTNVPQIERIIVHKLEELKELFDEEISLYKNLKQTFKANRLSVYPGGENMEELGLPELSGEQPPPDPSYQFQLDRAPNGEWLPVIIDPQLPPLDKPGDIVPVPIIEYISTYEPNPGKIEVRKNFTLPELEGRHFDLSFTRYSHHHTLGMISEVHIEPGSPPYQDPASEESAPTGNHDHKIIHISDSYKTAPEGGKYRTLIYYMEVYPEFKTYIFSDFFLRWKPLIDNNILKFNADDSSRPG